MTLWNTQDEIDFFTSTLNTVASVEKLFYTLEDGFYAYVPKTHSNIGSALQSRNTIIGHYTETWCKKLLEPIAKKHGLYALNTVQCDKIGLPRQAEADLAFCTTNEQKQEPQNIKLIFEIKMNIVSNYKYANGNIEYYGDYKTHKGSPSLLRSDSMLKAIGKSVNIRVSGKDACNIPIIILGNSPISKGYTHKVDYMLEDLINALLTSNLNYFSSMLPVEELGKIIQKASIENDYKSMANRFLSLLQQGSN